MNKKAIKNLKIFGAVIVLTVSSYGINENIINNNQEFINSIEFEQNIDELDTYVLQGLCKVDNKYLITAYDYSHNNNSIIYVLDEDLKTYRKKELNTNSHVGGITYDPINNNIWVTDVDGTVTAYDKDEVLSFRYRLTPKFKNIYVGEELESFFGGRSVAYITYHDNKLYVGNYNNTKNTIIKEYNLLKDGDIDTTKYNSYNISGYIQGITFYENEENDYLITSSSYGRLFKSKLKIYDADTLKIVKEITTKEMMEEVIIDEDKLITLYESNAKIYKNLKKSNDIIISDLNKILTKD